MRITSVGEVKVGDRVRIVWGGSYPGEVTGAVIEVETHPQWASATPLFRARSDVNPMGYQIMTIWGDELGKLFTVDTLEAKVSPAAVYAGSSCRGGCGNGLNPYAESDRGDGTHVCWSCKQRGAK